MIVLLRLGTGAPVDTAVATRIAGDVLTSKGATEAGLGFELGALGGAGTRVAGALGGAGTCVPVALGGSRPAIS